MGKAVKKGKEQATTLAKTKEYWTNSLDQAQAAFNKEKELFKTKYNKKPPAKKLNIAVGK